VKGEAKEETPAPVAEEVKSEEPAAEASKAESEAPGAAPAAPAICLANSIASPAAPTATTTMEVAGHQSLVFGVKPS
jgi:hypothetical protein